MNTIEASNSFFSEINSVKIKKHNRLTSVELQSNDWRAVVFGSGQLGLRDTSSGCERIERGSSDGGSSDGGSSDEKGEEGRVVLELARGVSKSPDLRRVYGERCWGTGSDQGGGDRGGSYF